MSGRLRSAFFAYPSKPSDLTTPIEVAALSLKSSDPRLSLQTWPQVDTFGFSIPDQVRDHIIANDILICDITQPNMNVYYEVGFAIGSGKTIAPVINTSFAHALTDIQKDGLFDNIGFKSYDNAAQLEAALLDTPGPNLIELYAKDLNSQQPFFILDTYRKTDFRNEVVSAIKDEKGFYRSFDPVEVPRFSTVSIIGEATASAGIVIPLLADHIDDAARHNIRAAFLAGLGHGLGRQTLILRMATSNPIILPADYREFIKVVRSEQDICDAVAEFVKASLIDAQSIRKASPRTSKSALQKLSLGAAAAENEFRTLEEYFVETSEFSRTLRGEIRLVAGRKGSGKTAIFFRVRDTLRAQKATVVVDLKPESHQLSLFREELLKTVGAGVFDHTLAAFWYLVLLSEILLTIKDRYDRKSRLDSRALAAAWAIDEALQKLGIASTGDFTARINRLGTTILREVALLKKTNKTLSPERLTSLIFRNGIAGLRSLIHAHTNSDSPMILLFDNIDKAWPTKGVHEFDIRLVRLLIEALDKIRRDFDAQDREFNSVVFLRNDIYELLLEETPDRGKAAEIRIDWTDRAKLRQVIYRRLQSSTGLKSENFQTLWERYFDPCVDTRELIRLPRRSLPHATSVSNQHHRERDCQRSQPRARQGGERGLPGRGPSALALSRVRFRLRDPRCVGVGCRYPLRFRRRYTASDERGSPRQVA